MDTRGIGPKGISSGQAPEAAPKKETTSEGTFEKLLDETIGRSLPCRRRQTGP